MQEKGIFHSDGIRRIDHAGFASHDSSDPFHRPLLESSCHDQMWSLKTSNLLTNTVQKSEADVKKFSKI